MIFQVKSSKSDTGFKAGDIDKFDHFAEVLLNISNTPENIHQRYHSGIVQIIDSFKAAALQVEVQHFLEKMLHGQIVSTTES